MCWRRPRADVQVDAVVVNGVDQSPIALADNMASLLRSKPIRLRFRSTSHTYLYLPGPDPLFNFTGPAPRTKNAGTEYGGRQFHFHEPGEHPINGHEFPLEFHIVFDGDEVSSIPPDILALAWVVRLTKHHRSSAIVRDVLAGRPMRVPDRSQLFVYTGSLTTGVPDSNVNWLVNKTPLRVTARDLAELRARAFVQGARSVQDRAGRAVSLAPTC